jgi:hypothetical protein
MQVHPSSSFGHPSWNIFLPLLYNDIFSGGASLGYTNTSLPILNYYYYD